DHVVAEFGESSADAPRPATRIEDAGATTDHRVDQPGFTVEVDAVRGHRAKPLDVPLGVPGVLFDLVEPPIACHRWSVAQPHADPAAGSTQPIRLLHLPVSLRPRH